MQTAVVPVGVVIVGVGVGVRVGVVVERLVGLSWVGTAVIVGHRVGIAEGSIVGTMAGSPVADGPVAESPGTAVGSSLPTRSLPFVHEGKNINAARSSSAPTPQKSGA